MLFRSGGAVFASTVAATAQASPPARRDGVPPNELGVLIEAHKTAYAVFGEAVHKTGGRGSAERAGLEEERALLAICAHPVVRECDRLVKARYLLEIEARGELDLPEHMQALLRSTMWEG